MNRYTIVSEWVKDTNGVGAVRVWRLIKHAITIPPGTLIKTNPNLFLK